MGQASRKQNARHPVAGYVLENIREISLLALLLAAAGLLTALLTFHPGDPGWSHSVSADGIHNRAGVVGAWIADIILYLFGYFGYVIPVMLLFTGWRLFQSRRRREAFNPLLFSLRGVGVLTGLIGGCAIASMHFHAGSALPDAARAGGGILGNAVGGALLAATSAGASTLLLLALFFTGLTLYSGLSWVAIMDHTGRLALYAVGHARRVLAALRGNAGDERGRGEEAGQDPGQEPEYRPEPDQEAEQRHTPPVIGPVPAAVTPGPGAGEEVPENRVEPAADTILPALTLLDEPPPEKGGYPEEALAAMSRQLELKLADFGVTVQVVAVYPGPVITRFELDPAPGVKVSQISNLARDLARSLAVVSVRVVDVIPGKPYIGLEIPNEDREMVTLGEILGSGEYASLDAPMVIALGKDISGNPVVGDLGRMPHLLVAGTTGSGKSVALNAMILSLLYKSPASEVRLIMIDPKMLELSVYEGIPNLLAPVVTDMKEAANALRWCVAEMERRYKLMAALGVRNIAGYNSKVTAAMQAGQPVPDPFYAPISEEDVVPTLDKLPYIVVIIDELADMMMTVGKKVEELIARLAQKARAAGVHLILATQRPSVDVITGLIKANVPSRIAFQVSSKVDSRTILDQMGAEHLLGHGDMLYLPAGTSIPERVHGAFVADGEVHKVVESLKARCPAPDYIDDILHGPGEGGAEAIPGLDAPGEESDPLYDEAVRIVTETRKASISYIQRRLKVGYNRAARIIEEMEKSGLVGPLESSGGREILAAPPPPAE